MTISTSPFRLLHGFVASYPGYAVYICKPGDSRKWFIRSVYHGQMTLTSDRTYARVYSLRGAQDMIKKIERGMLK